MSNVRATCGSVVATRVYVAAEPGATLGFNEQEMGWADVDPAEVIGIQRPLHDPLLMRTYGLPSMIARRDAVAVVVALVEPYFVESRSQAASNR
jgi:hypothetical protein